MSIDADLAILSVHSPKFCDDIPPMHSIKRPRLRENVLVIGHPDGSPVLCHTTGMLTSLTIRHTTTSSCRLPGLLADIPVSGGFSGGAMCDMNGNVVGVVSESFTRTVNGVRKHQALAISNGILSQFMKDVGINGYALGIPGCGFDWIERIGHCEKNTEHITGIKVTKVFPDSTESVPLADGDIITHVNRNPILNNGQVLCRGSIHGRFGKKFDELIAEQQVGKILSLSVHRNNMDRVVEYQLPNSRDSSLVPASFDMKPEFYVFGQYSFVTFSRQFLLPILKDGKVRGAPRRFFKLAKLTKTADVVELVMMNRLPEDFPTECVKIEQSRLVLRIDGLPVRSLKHLRELVESSSNDVIIAELGEDGLEEDVIIINNTKGHHSLVNR